MNAIERAANQWADVVLGIWSRRWYGLWAAWLTAALGALFVLALTPRYEATASIYVDTQSILRPLMQGMTVQPNADQQVVMLSRMLVSRPNVERLVDMVNLAPADEPGPHREAQVDTLLRWVQVKSTGRDNLYNLSYRDPDPQRAVRVVDSLVRIFIESNRSVGRGDSAAAKAFLDEQIPVYREKLETAESRLREFRLLHKDYFSADGNQPVSQVAEISAQLGKVRLELREALRAQEAARSALQGALLGEAIPTPDLDARIAAQQRSLDTLLQRYADGHPNVQAARQTLVELEQQRRAQVAELRAAYVRSGSAGAARSPAFDELNKVLATSRIQIATLRAREDEYSSRYEQAMARARDFPHLEAEAVQLSRDHAVHKKNYEDLLARRESAVMSAKLEAASGIAELRLIDPPRVAPQPVSPNPKLLLPLVPVAALIAGLGVAFLVSRLQPLCYRAADVREHFDVPLLGAVSMVHTAEGQRAGRAEWVRFLTASLGLVAAVAIGLWAMSMTQKF